MTLVQKESAATLKALAIACAMLAPFLIFFGTARSIVEIWNSSETFAHGYIILPISLWLIWIRRDQLKRMTPQPYWPGLLLVMACGFGWLLADLGDVQVVKQYMFAMMLPFAAITLLGKNLSRSMAFPLFFVLLAVPFGDVFIEPLINFTADFTVAALQATGIPVLRDGSSFSLPTGNWSVVEACSGVRYLISSFTLGCLYAYLTYRSLKRQLAFVVLSIIVPIIANGMRAYMIVMLGHLSGMRLAVGVDHLIYGWLFFGLVMFLMFWIGSYWRENKEEGQEEAVAKDSPAQTTMATANAAQASTTEKPVTTAMQFWVATLAVFFCMGIWPAYAQYLTRVGFNPAPIVLDSFHADEPEIAMISDWRPDFSPASKELEKSYVGDDGKIQLVVKYYRNQTHEASLISTANRIVAEHDPAWMKISFSPRSETLASQPFQLWETEIKSGNRRMLVWSWNWIAGEFTGNNYLGKLLQAKSKLLLAGDDGAAIIVAAPYSDKPEEARKVLRRFLDHNLASLETSLAVNSRH